MSETYQLLCEGRCAGYTQHSYAGEDIRLASEDKRILFRCDDCGQTRQFGLEVAQPSELAKARQAAA